MKKLLKFTNLNKIVLFSLLSVPTAITLTSAKDCWDHITLTESEAKNGFETLIESYKTQQYDTNLQSKLETIIANNIVNFWTQDTFHEKYQIKINPAILKYSDLKVKVTITNSISSQSKNQFSLIQDANKQDLAYFEVNYFVTLSEKEIKENANNAKAEFYIVINNLINWSTAQDELTNAIVTDKPAKQKILDKAKRTLDDSISKLKTLQDSKQLFTVLSNHWPIIIQNWNNVNVAQRNLTNSWTAAKPVNKTKLDYETNIFNNSILTLKTSQDSPINFTDFSKKLLIIKEKLTNVNSAQDELTKATKAYKPAKQKNLDNKLSDFHNEFKSLKFKAKDEYDAFIKAEEEKSNLKTLYDSLKKAFTSFKDKQIKLNKAQDELTNAIATDKPAKQKTVDDEKKQLASLELTFLNQQKAINTLGSKHLKLIPKPDW